MELERKFWIKESNLIFDYERMSLIEQIYINKPTDFYEIRLRKYHDEDRFYLDFKGKGDLTREKFGINLLEEQFDKILEKIENKKSILKKRYYLGDGVFYEEYDGELKGLNILEVEGDMERLNMFQLPRPFNNGVEVSFDPRFKNRNLIYYKSEDIKNFGNAGVTWVLPTGEVLQT
jgi:CYTH domain-containing protein